MAQLDSSSMTHEEVQKVLPWYVNQRLGAEESRRVEAHLAACPICHGDVAGLSTVFAVHERSLPDRPINEERLDALFTRIDRHEAERRRPAQSIERTGFLVRAMQWLTTHPSLAAGSLAAVLLAVFMSPALLQQRAQVGEEPGREYSVLSSKGADTAPFVLRLRFNNAPASSEVERLIAAASTGQAPSLPAYRIEQRSPTEFRIVFDSKPSVTVAGHILTQLEGAPNVAAAAIDADAAGDAASN
jgi:Putative zinc-finger